MVKTININVNAANPHVPIAPIHVLKGSAASLTICNMPRPFGIREITGVTVSVTNAAGTAIGVAAVAVGKCWGVTIPATHFAVVGTVTGGVTVKATGKDDAGDAAEWVLGSADLVVLDVAATVTPGEEIEYCLWHDDVPSSPKKGDICKISGTLKIYTGSAWESMGAGGSGPESYVKSASYTDGMLTLFDQDGNVSAKVDISSKRDLTDRVWTTEWDCSSISALHGKTVTFVRDGIYIYVYADGEWFGQLYPIGMDSIAWTEEEYASATQASVAGPSGGGYITRTVDKLALTSELAAAVAAEISSRVSRLDHATSSIADVIKALKGE